MRSRSARSRRSERVAGALYYWSIGNVGYSIQSIVALRGVYPAELPTGLVVVQLNDDVQMIPLGAMPRKYYGIPFLPLTDEGDVELPPALLQLCTQLSIGGDLAYIEAEIFGGAGV